MPFIALVYLCHYLVFSQNKYCFTFILVLKLIWTYLEKPHSFLKLVYSQKEIMLRCWVFSMTHIKHVFYQSSSLLSSSSLSAVCIVKEHETLHLFKVVDVSHKLLGFKIKPDYNLKLTVHLCLTGSIWTKALNTVIRYYNKWCLKCQQSELSSKDLTVHFVHSGWKQNLMINRFKLYIWLKKTLTKTH